MILHEANLGKVLEQAARYSVFYYYSTEEYLVRSYAAKTVAALLAHEDAETTRVEGPAPEIEAIVASAGTISLFGTRRIVEVPLVSPAAMKDEDVAALCDVMQSLENAVLVLTSVFEPDRKGAPELNKKAKQLVAAAEQAGVAAELTKPQPADARRFAQECAVRLGSSLSPTAATALVERCGANFFVLENEVAKLAAAVNYGEITRQEIARFGTQNIEADVFDMVRMVTSRRTGAALEKLQQLIDLQNDAIPIAAALAGSFIDMYRVKCGAQKKRGTAVVFKDFKYKGSEYRLKKSAETAAPYTLQQLEEILRILATLDAKLKSSATDSTVLLQTALCQIVQAGGKK